VYFALLKTTRNVRRKKKEKTIREEPPIRKNGMAEDTFPRKEEGEEN